VPNIVPSGPVNWSDMEIAPRLKAVGDGATTPLRLVLCWL
jgi:hypothetical protein